MRFIGLPLAVLAASFASGATAQDDARSKERMCVYDTLDDDEFDAVDALLVRHTGRFEPAVEAQLDAAMNAAVRACAVAHDWGAQRSAWAKRYAIETIAYEIQGDTLPASLDPPRLARLLEEIGSEDAYRLTREGTPQQDAAWAQRVRSKLAAAGLPAADQPAAVLYLIALANLTMASAAWDDLVARGTR